MVADTQASTMRELGFVRQDLLSATRNTAAAFAIHHGDVMGDDLSLLPAYLDIVKETGIDWHHCPGNHDMDHAVPSAAHAFTTWQRTVGPASYAFEFGRAIFIILNNVEYLPPVERTDPGRPYRGNIAATDLQFVQGILAAASRDRLVVVSLHIPLASFTAPDCDASTTVNGRALLDLLSGRLHSLSFAGHSHTTEHHAFGSHRHQVLTAACGSWWSGVEGPDGVPVAISRDGSPRGHHVLTIDGHHATTRFVAAGAASQTQMRLMLTRGGSFEEVRPDVQSTLIADGKVLPHDVNKLLLLADIFDGRPSTVVTVTFAAGDPGIKVPVAIAMTPLAVRDPYAVHSFASAPQLCKPWVEACVSSHIWTAALPVDLPLGAYTCSVTATNESGATHSSSLTFDVMA